LGDLAKLSNAEVRRMFAPVRWHFRLAMLALAGALAGVVSAFVGYPIGIFPGDLFVAAFASLLGGCALVGRRGGDWRRDIAVTALAPLVVGSALGVWIVAWSPSVCYEKWCVGEATAVAIGPSLVAILVGYVVATVPLARAARAFLKRGVEARPVAVVALVAAVLGMASALAFGPGVNASAFGGLRRGETRRWAFYKPTNPLWSSTKDPDGMIELHRERNAVRVASGASGALGLAVALSALMVARRRSRLIARVRAGDASGLAMVALGEEPGTALVRVAAAGTGAYRAGQVAEPIVRVDGLSPFALAEDCSDRDSSPPDVRPAVGSSTTQSD
jgi:hypothetical protein